MAWAGVASTSALLGASAAHASGFYIQEASIRGLGRAYSGEAADQGAASIWWNPAAIAGNPTSTVYGGIAGIIPRGDVNNVDTLIVRPGQAPAPVGGNQSSKDPLKKGAVPSGAAAYKINDQWSVGISMTAPFSFETNYDSDSWARYTADKTRLTTFDLQPTIAFAPSPLIGIGVAANIEHSKASLSNFLPNLSPLLPDGHQTLRGKGWDFGFTVGVQIHPSKMIDLGLSYKSSITHTLKGEIVTAGLLGPLAGQNGTIPGIKAKFRTPWQAIGSARIHVNDKLTLDGQVVRAGWNKFDEIRIGAPINTALPENYHNSWSVAGGLDYVVNSEWTVRGGIQWDQTPTRNGQRDARVPDSSRVNFSAGTSYAVTRNITIDGAASYITFKTVSIDRATAAYAGTPVQIPILVNGTTHGTHAIILGMGARMSF
jgi:long-chain fatty acid transport protein